jgi:hypothetical protein
MPSVGHIMQLLSEVGITRAQLVEALSDDVVKAAVIEKTKQVQAYWKSIAPVSDKKEHDWYGEPIGPGTYRDSVSVRFKEEDGKPVGIVYTRAPHAVAIEYGNAHVRAQGIAQKVVDHFEGTEMA